MASGDLLGLSMLRRLLALSVRCPRCEGQDIRRSRQPYGRLLTTFGFVACRCRRCRARFALRRHQAYRLSRTVDDTLPAGDTWTPPLIHTKASTSLTPVLASLVVTPVTRRR